MGEIGRLSEFRIGEQVYHNSDPLGPHDRGLSGTIPAHRITPLELIDDACAFEAIADKLSH